MDLEKVDFLTEIDCLRRGWQACEARLAVAEAERDAARAGEARAVEALDVFARAYRVSMLPFAPGIDEADGAYHWMPHGWPSVADFRIANEAMRGFALDWLAQREAEAIEAERRANTDVIRSLGPEFCDFVFDGPGAIEYLSGVLAQREREAAAKALEGIGAKQTSASGPAAQKVETLIFLADTADKLVRLDCELIDRAAMAQRAALFRECAAMMRERGALLTGPDWKRIAELEAERDAARAGEARVVEAINALLAELHQFDFEIDGSVEFFDSVQLCRDAVDPAQPAHDWLAQQRREAAAEALLGLKDSIRGGTYRPHVAWRCISTRAAALRAGATGETDRGDQEQ